MYQKIVIEGADLTNYIKSVKWSRNDIDAPGSGRDMNGNMRRGRVAIKAKLEFECLTMSQEQLIWLGGIIGRETVSVSYLDPHFGQRTARFYGSSLDSSVWSSDKSTNQTMWESPKFNLVEV